LKIFKMMMLKMMNPFGSMPVPGVGDDNKEESAMSKEELQEQERLRQAAIKQAEKERRDKYRKQDEEREVMRSGIREKYNIAKPVNEDEDSDEDDDDDTFGAPSKKQEEDDDPVAQAKAMAEKQMSNAKDLAQEKCSLQ